MGQCSGLERTNFEPFSTLGGSGGLVRTDFEQFLFWEGVVVLKEHMEMHREALGTYKGVFEHIGCWGHQDGVQMHGGIQTYGGVQMPKHMGVSSQCPPKCKSYMPLKKGRGV